MKNYADLTVKMKKEFWKLNPLIGNIEIKVSDINKFFMVCKNDDTVVKELYWTNFNGWELTSIVLWKDLLKLVGGGNILDIGAYSGIYSLIAAQHCNKCTIFAFDIQSNCISRLKENIDINGFTNIFVNRFACTDFNGKIPFYYYKEEDIISSVASIKENKMNDLEEIVEAIRLDDFSDRFEFTEDIKLIKIDVEGAEQSTLLGLQKILKKSSPDVLIEVNKKNDLKEVKRLFPNDYNLYDINEDLLELKKVNWYTRISEYRNYLFTKKNKSQLKTIFIGKIK